MTIAFSPLRQKKINHPYAICISFAVHKLVIVHSETYLVALTKKKKMNSRHVLILARILQIMFHELCIILSLLLP